MKPGELKNITLDDLYWFFKAGKSKRRLTTGELRSNLNRYVQKPVFFLSTGRCGTMWFSELMAQNKSLMVLHSPKPALAHQSKVAHRVLSLDNNTTEREILKELFLAAREQDLRYAYKTQKRYVETNNYITFFAPLLKELFPDAKFVHLYRHPGEFVRSGIRRGYFGENNPEDLKRITPLVSPEQTSWTEFNRIQKTAWLWNETNGFVERFKAEYEDSFYSFNFNNLTSTELKSLFDFLELSIPEQKISKMLNKSFNTQKTGNFESYDQWDEEKKQQLRDLCSVLMDKYNYS